MLYLCLLAVALEAESLVLRYSPGNSPNERTLPSKSSSISDSGVTLKIIYTLLLFTNFIPSIIKSLKKFIEIPNTLFYQRPTLSRLSISDWLPCHGLGWFLSSFANHDEGNKHHDMEAHLNDPLTQEHTLRLMLRKTR